MVGKVDYTGVPTTMDLENNSNQKKYKVNSVRDRGILISKPLCALLVLGVILLALLVGLLVFFLVPRECEGDPSKTEPLSSGDSWYSETMLSDIDKTDERLPRNVVPNHYRIQIQPDFENSITEGAVRMTLEALEETDTVIFNVHNITINAKSVRMILGNRSLDIGNQEYLDGQRYEIKLKEKLQKNENYLLEMNFMGKLDDRLQGFYQFQYTDRYDQPPRNASATQFSPTDARRAFPCFDEPSFKATFTISLARPRNMKTLSNMALKQSDLFISRKDWVWDHYPETPKISTYIVAFIISDLSHAQREEASVKVWSREIFLAYTEYAYGLAPKIIQFFENYFGSSFPVSKIDIVAVPESGYTAMENWGLITFRENSLLFDKRTSTVDDQRAIATILSHEIAHQWFGNLVTPKWWDDLWLKEGFATYLQYLAVNHIEPTWKVLEDFSNSETERAMAIDGLRSSRPISAKVFNSRQIKQTFDEISYAKGACITRMMKHFLGEDTFKNGLKNFLLEYSHGNADRQDLFSVLTNEAHKSGSLAQSESLNVIMKAWTEKPGFPVITAIADYQNHILTLNQKRFLFTKPQPEKSNWWVPLSFVTDLRHFNDTKPKFWLKGDSEMVVNVEFKSWYLLNVDQTGYFIVNYDERNWRELTAQIMELPVRTRAQLISDSMDLAKANLLDYDIPLRMIANMAVRDEHVMFVPTEMALNKLQFISDMLLSTPAFGLFEEYHNAVFRNTYKMVDFADANDDYITKRIRRLILKWSCRNSDTANTNKAIVLFRDAMNDERTKSVSPNLRSVVFCTAIREGGEREWDYVFDRYQRTISPSEKNDLLDALGCTKLKWLLSGYIDKLIDEHSSIRIQDADRVFESVARNRDGISIAFDFLRSNWNELLTYYGDGFDILGKMIKALAPHMNTEFQLADLERFRNNIKSNISTTTMAFDSAIQTVKSNVEWMKKNYDQVYDWFDKHKHKYETF